MMLSNLRRLVPAAGLLLAPLVLPAQEAGVQQSDDTLLLQQLAVDSTHLFATRGIPLAFILLLTAVILFFANQREKRRQELLARFVDKGQEIPAALLPGVHNSRQASLRRGVLFTCLGLGLGAAIYIASGELKFAVWCLIPLLLGVASFINAVLLYPKSDSGR